MAGHTGHARVVIDHLVVKGAGRARAVLRS
jgi:hypothetical protein